MNKLGYNMPHQRTTSNNYWLGGGMANNLVNPIESTLDAIEGDVNIIAQDLMENLIAYSCSEKIAIEIEPQFRNMEELIQQDNAERDLYFYHGDHLGSSSWITDASGSVNQYLAYLPFGENFVNQKTNRDIRFKFTGKERDSETGFDYFGARYLDSELSIWLSVDPLASKYPNTSPFMYVRGNPIMLIDPNGLFDISALKKKTNYGVVAVYQTDYKAIDKKNKNNALASDIKAARKAGVPVIFVDDVGDYADAMKAMDKQGSSTKSYTLNSHGNDGYFKIGSTSINKNTNMTKLMNGLKGKNVFIGACSVTSGQDGKSLIENFSKQTSSTVFAKDSEVSAGYSYNGNTSGLSTQPLRAFFGLNSDNKFHMSTKGSSATQIYNFAMKKDGTFLYNTGGSSSNRGTGIDWGAINDFPF